MADEIDTVADIEQRGAEEVATMTGKTRDGRIETVRIVPDGSPVVSPQPQPQPQLLAAEGGLPLLERVRGIVAPELGWDDTRWSAEADAYRALWQSDYAPAT